MEEGRVLWVSLPFKDQTSANEVRRQMRDLSHKIGPTLQPVFISKELEQDLSPKKSSLRSYINSAWSIYFHVICVMQLMSVKIKKLGDWKTPFGSPRKHKAPQRKRSFEFSKSAKGNFDCLVYEMICTWRVPKLKHANWLHPCASCVQLFVDFHILTHLLFLLTICTFLSTSCIILTW